MQGPGDPQEESPTTESTTPQPLVDFGTTSEGSGAFWSSEPEAAAESYSTPDHEPHPVTEGTMSEGPGEEGSIQLEPIEFDERYREDFTGLCFAGKVSDEFTYLSHRFKIRSLTVEELITIGLLHAKYQSTLADVKAYQTLVVAACIEQLDGKQLPIPIGPNEELIEARFNYVSKNWFPFTIDEIYSKYMVLEARVQATVEAMGKASGSAALTPG